MMKNLDYNTLAHTIATVKFIGGLGVKIGKDGRLVRNILYGHSSEYANHLITLGYDVGDMRDMMRNSRTINPKIKFYLNHTV